LLFTFEQTDMKYPTGVFRISFQTHIKNKALWTACTRIGAVRLEMFIRLSNLTYSE